MKTKEQIAKYNKEYFARPEVIERAKIRNAKYRKRRKEYKKTEKGRKMDNKYRRNAYHKNKGKRILYRYGITLFNYEVMLDRQKGACAICEIVPKTPLHIDHCHVTGSVRGLLCGSCNRALGLLKDNTNFLSKAIEYLSK